MTLWGSLSECMCRTNGVVACTWLSSGCDWDFRPQNNTPKVQTHVQHRNWESGYSSVKQSNRYITHGLYGCAAHWQHIMCSARLRYDAAYPKMAWTDEAFLSYFSTCTSTLAEWIPTQELWVRQQYKEQCHRGGRSVSSPLVNHFWICSIRAASDLQHNIR